MDGARYVSGRIFKLLGEQAQAVDPRDSVWLSASAGTGKTQVLSARVLRLLLQEDTSPDQILCLTFTKAGAAEMAVRVNEVLANWVRMKPEALGADLLAIGADSTPATRERARTLFASVLDCPGGGLRIDTIHAFAQWLLSAFPDEAGIMPGARPMEDRDRELLARRTLRDLLDTWEASGDSDAITALELLSLRMGPDGARAWLMRCAEAREAWFGPGAWQEPMRARVEQLLGLEAGSTRADVSELCADARFAVQSLQQWAAAHAAWGTKTGLGCADAIATWLAGDSAGRLEGCDTLVTALFTQKGEPRSLSSIEKHDPTVGAAIERVAADLAAIRERLVLIDLVELITPALQIGRRFALAWEEAKQREGLVDFDDLIRRAAMLLRDADQGAWIRYKLDRRFDHILIDEAQDTNEAQWAIIKALTDDFFSGMGQAGEKLRTIFVVGDYKQAIFRFQGTSPENFAAQQKRYAELMADWVANAAAARSEIDARSLVSLGLGRSYRTAQSVLDFVDEAIAAIGHANFGLESPPEAHVGDKRPGLVTLWNPVSAQPDDGEEDPGGAEGWVSAPERRMADRIAAQVKAWMDSGFPLAKGTARNAGPGDVMVLVRKRRELAGLIVARLNAAGVPVAGVDRLRLGAPLAVKDLMAALRFAAQPFDNLSLACLLVSPLFGWSQEELLRHGYRAEKVSLWNHLRRSREPAAIEVVDRLRALLARADFEPPQALLHWILLGPWQGRRQLVARLGREANDPIDELLNAALAFSASNTPSLQGFIQWFDAGDGDLKREADAGGGMVRVMTVHGSKGLQAPIVILADATGNPDTSPTRGLELSEDLPGGGGRTVPIPDLTKDQKVGPIAAIEERAAREERQEHWRLLYVAMTRAEEALFIGGALGKREEQPAPDSWYARLAPLMRGEAIADPVWSERRERGEHAPVVPRAEQQNLAIPPALPGWATRPIGEEPRPPRPLAPSSAGEDSGADPPLPAGQAEVAARRGVLIHALLERMPDVAEELRQEMARSWLARRAADMSEHEREEMLERALAVLSEPDWADLFSPKALAEVPLAATVGGQVVAGTADRLLIEADRVLVADFKTARRPPASLAQVPQSTLRQMGAYAAALAQIFPGRRIEAAILYTQTPQLIAIPAAVLEDNKPGFSTPEESLPD